MKTKTTILIISLLLAFGSLFAQTNQDYYTYAKNKQHYFDSVRAVTPDSLKVSGKRSFERWSDFWRSRVYNSATVTGSYEKYADKLQEAMINPAHKANSNSPWNRQMAGNQNLTTPALPRESFRVAYSLGFTAKNHNEYPAAVDPDLWGFDGEIIMYLSHLV